MLKVPGFIGAGNKSGKRAHRCVVSYLHQSAPNRPRKSLLLQSESGDHYSGVARDWKPEDAQEVAPALDEVEEPSGQVPEKLSLDNGYYSGKNVQEVKDRQVEAYFRNELSDSFFCLGLRQGTRDPRARRLGPVDPGVHSRDRDRQRPLRSAAVARRAPSRVTQAAKSPSGPCQNVSSSTKRLPNT